MKLFCPGLIILLAVIGCKHNSTHSYEKQTLANLRIIDLTYELSEETVFWVTAKEFEMEVVAAGQTEGQAPPQPVFAADGRLG